MIKLNDILTIDDFSDFRIRFVLSWGNEPEQNPLERYRNDPDDPMRHYLWKGNKATGFKVGTKVIGLIRLAGDNWLLTHVLEITAVNDVPVAAALPTIDEQLNYWYNAEPKEIDIDTLRQKIIQRDSTDYILIGRPTCSECRETISYIITALEKEHIPILYLNTDKYDMSANHKLFFNSNIKYLPSLIKITDSKQIKIMNIYDSVPAIIMWIKSVENN